MNFRRLGMDDVDCFREIRLTALRDSPENYASTYDDWDRRTDADYRAILRTERVFAVFDGPVAVALAGLVNEEKSKMAHRTTLAMVFVDPERRGSTAADVLMKGVIDQARADGRKQIEAAVNAENARAIRYYKRYGFEKIGKTPRGFVHKGRYIDEVLMVLMLDKAAEPA